MQCYRAHNKGGHCNSHLGNHVTLPVPSPDKWEVWRQEGRPTKRKKKSLARQIMMRIKASNANNPQKWHRFVGIKPVDHEAAVLRCGRGILAGLSLTPTDMGYQRQARGWGWGAKSGDDYSLGDYALWLVSPAWQRRRGGQGMTAQYWTIKCLHSVCSLVHQALPECFMPHARRSAHRYTRASYITAIRVHEIIIQKYNIPFNIAPKRLTLCTVTKIKRHKRDPKVHAYLYMCRSTEKAGTYSNSQGRVWNNSRRLLP